MKEGPRQGSTTEEVCQVLECGKQNKWSVQSVVNSHKFCVVSWGGNYSLAGCHKAAGETPWLTPLRVCHLYRNHSQCHLWNLHWGWELVEFSTIFLGWTEAWTAQWHILIYINDVLWQSICYNSINTTSTHTHTHIDIQGVCVCVCACALIYVIIWFVFWRSTFIRHADGGGIDSKSNPDHGHITNFMN